MNTKIDITAPGKKTETGKAHILSKTIREFEDIFTKMGFEIASGPEVQSEHYNFDTLNVPKNHPSRDMQDTFWVKDLVETVLRTHTSGVQTRYMDSHQPPIRIVAPGRVYRNEAIDATHEAQFHQIEGLMVGETVSLANLKATLLGFLREWFENENIGLRIRPGYFPFVEPGIEVDMTCHKCGGSPEKTCNVCKGSGWIEIGGAGMVHPNVFKSVGIDDTKYQGWAFGFGIERMTMLKYGVDDIREFYDGDLPFLRQF